MNISYNLVKIIFSYLKEPKLLDLIRHNKNLQKICNKTIKDYQLFFLSKFIDIFTYSFVYHDNYFFHISCQYISFLYDTEQQLIRILSFKEPIYINKEYEILNEIYQNEINLYNSLLETFNISSLIEYLFSQNKIKIQLLKEKIIKTIKCKRGRYRGRRGSRCIRGNRMANGDRDTDCMSEDDDEEEYEEKHVKEHYKILYIYNKIDIYSEEFDTIKEVLNRIKKYNNINLILEFEKYSNNIKKSLEYFEYQERKNKYLIEDKLNL